MQLRTRGGLHDHPSSLNAIYRIRMILLGKNPGMVHTHSNVVTPIGTEKEEYLLASAMKQAKIGNITIEKPENMLEDVADSSPSSSSTSSGMSSVSRMASEKDGLLYIAGYLAKKHLKDHPYIGQYTYESKEVINLHSYSIPSWIESLSFGGLIQPSDKWAQQVEKMEKYFNKFHKENFRQGKHIVKRTINYITKKVSEMQISHELIKSFCRQRVFIRIKFLNMKRHEYKLGKRKSSALSSAEHSRKLTKKMKKIIT
ncbi:hypothetical protein NQ314_011290 [Rhamnusium bicolor]|uniref:Transposable element P transposase-like C-terminal domain-containing protein n=1 Tax=Rhamnusium bicolor TaxID=1586634 RepID=A0AAV8XIT0_9CUCU|nr:hypothetical protein NQ314_011290 [Rhamnusium bicolor]